MNHAAALFLAQELIPGMTPACHQVWIAGSLRRGKPEVRDIELVAVPRWEETADPTDLFGERAVRVNLLHEWATTQTTVQWIKPGAREVVPCREGRLWRGSEPLETPTEESVFDALDLRYVAPEARTGAEAVRVR